MHNPDSAQEALKKASDILSTAGLSHFIVITEVMDTPEGQKLVPMNAITVARGNTLNLLEGIWMALGRFFHTHYESSIPETFETLFGHGRAVAESTARVMYQQGKKLEEKLLSETPKDDWGQLRAVDPEIPEA